MTPLKSRAEKLFNSKAWCDADQDGIRGLEGHIPLLVAFATEVAAEVRLAALEEVISEIRGSCGMHPDYWDAGKQSAASVIEKRVRALKESPCQD